MLPELFRIPFLDFPIYTYGALLATGILLAIWLSVRFGAEDGLDPNRLYNLALWIVIGALVGAKLLMLITEWESFRGDWRRIFSLDFVRAGGVFYGGFLGGLATAVFLIKKNRFSGWKVADAFAPGIALGQTIGRLGCFAAGCCWGRPTTSWVGVEFTAEANRNVGVPIGVHLHPTQLYEASVTLLIFFFLLWLRKRRAYTGQVVLTYILLYATARFLIEFYRDDLRGWVGLFSTSQFIALVLIIGAVFFLWRKRGQGMTARPHGAGSG